MLWSESIVSRVTPREDHTVFCHHNECSSSVYYILPPITKSGIRLSISPKVLALHKAGRYQIKHLSFPRYPQKVAYYVLSVPIESHNDICIYITSWERLPMPFDHYDSFWRHHEQKTENIMITAETLIYSVRYAVSLDWKTTKINNLLGQQ